MVDPNYVIVTKIEEEVFAVREGSSYCFSQSGHIVRDPHAAVVGDDGDIFSSVARGLHVPLSFGVSRLHFYRFQLSPLSAEWNNSRP